MQNSPNEQSCTYHCEKHVVAENAIRLHMKGGMEANQISRIGKRQHSEEQATGFDTTRDTDVS